MKISEVEFLNVKIGKNVHIVKPSNIYGSELGDDVFVGPFVKIQKLEMLQEFNHIHLFAS